MTITHSLQRIRIGEIKVGDRLPSILRADAAYEVTDVRHVNEKAHIKATYKKEGDESSYQEFDMAILLSMSVEVYVKH